MKNLHTLKQLGKVLGFVFGTGVLVWLLWVVGWPAIQENLSAIGGWFWVVVAIFIVAQVCFFFGWWVVIDEKLVPANAKELFGIYLAGDSINYLIPSGNLAGEPLKAHLLRPTMGFGQAMTSITIHKHAEIASQFLFLVLGVLISIYVFDLPSWAQDLSILMVCGLGLALWLLTRLLKRGTFGPIIQWITKWKFLGKYIEHHTPAAHSLDQRLQTFYQQHNKWFFVSVGWCLLGWGGGVLETYVLLQILDPTKGWLTAISIESFSIALNNLFLFVPAKMGSAEGVRTGVCMLFGIPPSHGVAYGLVRRGRELICHIPGLVFLLLRQGGRMGQVEMVTPPR